MNRGFGINFLDEVSESMKNQWSMLHTSHQLYKMFASVLLVQSPSRYPTKKTKPIKTVVGPNSPRSFGGKKTNPRVCLVQNVKNHRVFCRVADIKGVCKAWATPQTAWYPAAPAWEHQHKPLEFGSEILDKTQVTTSEHRLKMRNKWKNGVGIVRFK